MEPKKIYFAVKEDVPETEYVIPLGKARVSRSGNDVTVVTYGYMFHVTMKAVEKLSKDEGIDAEVIDLRTIVPYDLETVLESVSKTGKLVIVVEAPRILSVASEISAVIAEKAIDYIDGPIIRVTGWDMPFPYRLENFYMPTEKRIIKGIRKALSLE